MKTTYAAAALALLMTGVAAPAMAQSAQDWSGPYVGVFGGFIQPNDDDTETLLFDRDFDGQYDDTVITAPTATPPGANAFSPGFCGDQIGKPAPVAAGGFQCDDDASGVEGGAKVGYDFQFGNWVVGAVGEVAAVDAEDSVTGFTTTPAFYSFTRNLEQMAGLRARLGYAAGNVLGYVTGGAAYGKIENSFVTNNTANSFTVTADEEDADGYQFGGGLEWRLAPNLSVNGEYIYSSLETGDYNIRVGNSGTTPATNPFILAPNTAGTDMIRESDEFKLHSFRIGMNVRF